MGETDDADPTGVASTIGKAAIVVLVLFSIPLQVHPCRASLDAVLKWRPNRASRNTQSNALAASPMVNASGVSRNDPAAMSDGRFALLTAVILTLAYITALSVNSLDRMLAFVGSTGSTSISFILPGLFYYKISDPDSIHHQRMMKEDDDMDDNGNSSDVEDTSALAQSTHSLHSNASGSNSSPSTWRWRRKWRWNFDRIEHGLLRKLSLGMAFYGIVVMAVCLIMNIFIQVGH